MEGSDQAIDSLIGSWHLANDRLLRKRQLVRPRCHLPHLHSSFSCIRMHTSKKANIGESRPPNMIAAFTDLHKIIPVALLTPPRVYHSAHDQCLRVHRASNTGRTVFRAMLGILFATAIRILQKLRSDHHRLKRVQSELYCRLWYADARCHRQSKRPTDRPSNQRSF